MSNQTSKQNKPTKNTYKTNKNLYVQPEFSAMRKVYLSPSSDGYIFLYFFKLQMIVYSTEVAYETKQIAKKSLFNFWGDKLCKHNLPCFYEEKLISI